MTSFYSREELAALGLKSFGKNVFVSRKSSIYDAGNITLGDHVRIDDFCILSGTITLGSYIHISAQTMLFAGIYGIELKDFVTVSSRCAFYALSDDYSGNVMTNPLVPEIYRNVYGGKILIKEHAILGSGCTVLPDLNIEEGAVAGAMTLVNKTLKAWTVYAGIPCRPLKKRSKKLLEFAHALSPPPRVIQNTISFITYSFYASGAKAA